jgi:polysaccharide export outer membrane protein
MAALLATTGCNSFIPSSGPRMGGIMQPASQLVGDPGSAANPALRYALLTLDPAIVTGLEADQPASLFSPRLIARPATEGRLGTGDIVAISIFETQSGGLFIPLDAGTRPGNFVTLPQQQIGRDGMVTIPFAGQIRAAGRMAAELETAIAARLRQRALEPQVIVTLVDRRSSTISVVGDVDQSLRFPLDPGGSASWAPSRVPAVPASRPTRRWSRCSATVSRNPPSWRISWRIPG